jgi:hypothetical protein
MWVALSCGAVVVAHPGEARAQGAEPSAADTAKAQQAFLKGVQLFNIKKYGAALEQFQISYDTVPSPNSRLYVARCKLQLGESVEAYREFGKVIDEANQRAASEPKYKPTAETAELEQTELAAKIALVSASVIGAEPGAKLTLNGAIVPNEEWGNAQPLEPGSATLTLQTADGRELTETVEIAAGERKDVTLDATPVAPPPDDTPPPPPPAEEPSEPPGVLLPIGIAAAGVGVVGLGLFAIAGSMSNSTFDELEATCGNSPCPESEQETIDAGKTEQTVANVGLIVGAVGLAAGTALIIVSLTGGKSSGELEVGGAKVDIAPGYLGVRSTF